MEKQLRILIVDDNKMMVKTLQDIFRVKGYQTEAAYSGREAMEKIENYSFDCILSDIKMPDLNGVELFEEIKTRQPNIPVVLMTAYATDRLIEQGLTAGVVAVLTKPLDLEKLFDFLTLLKQQRSVVVVDDDPDFCKTLADILHTQDFDVLEVTDPEGVVEKLQNEGQVVLLDMKLNQTSGLDILRQIKERYPNFPVILVTGYRDEVAPAIEIGLTINAFTYLSKPLQIDKLIRLLTQLYHQELGRKLGQPIVKKI